MTELYEKIKDILNQDIVDRHSLFQLRYFVVGKEPTHQAKLWRCLIELKSRKDSLDAISLELEDVNDNIELLEIKKEKTKFPNNPALGFDIPELETREMSIILRQIDRQKASLIVTLEKLKLKKKFLEEEASFFAESYLTLSQKEKLKPYDDLESQLKFWNEKLNIELNLKLLLRQPLDTELVKTILALNDAAPVKKQMIDIINQIQTTVPKKLDDKKQVLELKDKSEK